MLLKTLPCTKNTTSPASPMVPVKPSLHPTKTPSTFPELRSLLTTRQLAIECWLRDATTSPLCTSTRSGPTPLDIHYQSHNDRRQPPNRPRVKSFASANESRYCVELVTLQEYSPCQFILQDLHTFNTSQGSSLTKDNNNLVFSNIFAISIQNHSAGVTWSGVDSAQR